jgi:hypothetical protein
MNSFLPPRDKKIAAYPLKFDFSVCADVSRVILVEMLMFLGSLCTFLDAAFDVFEK